MYSQIQYSPTSTTTCTTKYNTVLRVHVQPNTIVLQVHVQPNTIQPYKHKYMYNPIQYNTVLEVQVHVQPKPVTVAKFTTEQTWYEQLAPTLSIDPIGKYV